MTRIAIALAAITALGTAAHADSKPSDAEATRIKDTLAVWGCEGGTMEKETEASGLFEIDDAKCKDGRQYDLKLDKDYRLMTITRD